MDTIDGARLVATGVATTSTGEEVTYELSFLPHYMRSERDARYRLKVAGTLTLFASTLRQVFSLVEMGTTWSYAHDGHEQDAIDLEILLTK